MHYPHVMQRLQSSHNLLISLDKHYLNENFPDFRLVELRALLLVLADFLEQVSVVSVLHYNAA